MINRIARTMKIIRDCGLRHKYVKIRYLKKSTGNVVTRLIAPYSLDNTYVHATTTKKKSHIRTFILRNIRSVKEADRSFRPKWEIEL